MSITCSSRAFISARISLSDAYIVFAGSDSAGRSNTSSDDSDGIAAFKSSGRATIVLYGSTGTSSTNGVPSDWQKRMLSSNVLSQVGHRFIDFLQNSTPYKGGVAAASADGVVLKLRMRIALDHARASASLYLSA
jgi:hypothetical protein